MPRNRQIAEMFFYMGWIERWGSGIQKILDECMAAGLPEPDFDERQGALWVTFHKDIFSEDQLRAMGLNERQLQAALFTKERGSITNREYRQLTNVSDEIARTELGDLVSRGLFSSEGKGRSVKYVIRKVGD